MRAHASSHGAIYRLVRLIEQFVRFELVRVLSDERTLAEQRRLVLDPLAVQNRSDRAKRAPPGSSCTGGLDPKDISRCLNGRSADSLGVDFVIDVARGFSSRREPFLLAVVEMLLFLVETAHRGGCCSIRAGQGCGLLKPASRRLFIDRGGSLLCCSRHRRGGTGARDCPTECVRSLKAREGFRGADGRLPGQGAARSRAGPSAAE